MTFSTNNRYTTLLKAQRDFESADRVIDQMRRESKLEPSLMMLNCSLNKCKTIQSGERVMERIRNAKMCPNVFTYNTLLKTCTSDPEKAEMFMKQMIEQDKVEPNVRTYTTLMNSYTDPSRAETLLSLMKNKGVGVNVIAYVFVMVVILKTPTLMILEHRYVL